MNAFSAPGSVGTGGRKQVINGASLSLQPGISKTGGIAAVKAIEREVRAHPR